MSDRRDQERSDRTTASVSPYPGDRTVHGLLEDWADGTPDAPALRYGEAALTYRQLDERANRLAHHLLRNGAGAEARVGLAVRDENWVVGALAALKAGACYVPLDPEYPAERLAYMARDAGVDVVLSTRRHDVDLPGRRIDVDAPDLAAEPATRPDVRVGPQSLAYIMYTSGSTGGPKGVAVTHRNIVRLVRSADSIEVRRTDTAAQAATISFDAATLETWGALLNGARLVGLARDDVLVAERLRGALAAHGVDVLFLPTALLRQVAAEDPAVFRGLRSLSFGGEQADARTLARVAAHCPDTELVNLYGPTEITTYATAHRCGDVTGADRTVPIGRPAANSAAYLLDEDLRPVPAGTPGELFLGGDGVARGYLGRPGLTARRFLPDPFAAEPGARMYRTGDLARRRADGALEFLGRVDRQVKVRGHRVEPAEVEEVLRGLPGVVEVVVSADRDPHGGLRLVAHVVLDGVGPADVRAGLAGRLPGYLVPAVFVVLPRLPLNANGKVDLAALRVPSADGGDDGRSDADPDTGATPAERELLAIWRESLGVPVHGVDADFFDLGGNSLAAARVRSRLSAATGVEVPLHLVFDHPTVASLAAAVAALTPPRGPAGPVAAEAAAEATPAVEGAQRDVADLLAEFEGLDPVGPEPGGPEAAAAPVSVRAGRPRAEETIR
ncbi:non-ribosomal peptide synthetase [Kitasatospora sp. NPDC048538]|uniref:non-ribosomal peptide synthetase n=1 Tax=unclassified Kitasatospora TaxID=2633591 RepID=UPI0033FED57F